MSKRVIPFLYLSWFPTLTHKLLKKTNNKLLRNRMQKRIDFVLGCTQVESNLFLFFVVHKAVGYYFSHYNSLDTP